MPKLNQNAVPVSSHDWHRADIKAALEKRGVCLSRLGMEHGYTRWAGSKALDAPWPKMERLIAAAIGAPPQQIWPSRYREDGTPKSGRNERGLGRYKRKGNGSTGQARRNGNIEGAA